MKPNEIIKTLEDIAEVGIVNHKQTDAVREAIVLLKAPLITKGGQKVIRCEDCSHCYYASNRVPEEQSYVCDKNGIDVWSDWYCADGERNEGR